MSEFEQDPSGVRTGNWLHPDPDSVDQEAFEAVERAILLTRQAERVAEVAEGGRGVRWALRRRLRTDLESALARFRDETRSHSGAQRDER